jgi:ATP:ADP antiporter, AAA family
MVPRPTVPRPSLRSLAGRLVEARTGEGLVLARSAAALFVMIASHTLLETVRDALLLSRFPPRALGVVYIAGALAVVPASVLVAKRSADLGPRRMLAGATFAMCFALAGLTVVPTGLTSIVLIYVAASLVGAVLVPLYWSLIGTVFTVVQGRRLLGVVTAAGTLGGVAGAGLAVVLLKLLPIKDLLLVSATGLALTSLLVPRAAPEAARQPDRSYDSAVQAGSPPYEPFLGRVAALVGLSTAALVLVDFAFKWTVTRSVPTAEIAPFVARYYALLNAAALIAQLVASGRLLRRFGVTATLAVTPLLLAFGSAAWMLSGAAFLPMLILKGIDGTLRNSVYRVTTELLYLPITGSVRARVKPLIDGALARGVQGIVGAALLIAGVSGRISGRALAMATFFALAAWLLLAWRTRAPYLNLLRRSIAGDTARPITSTDPLDMETAEGLVEHLSHDDSQLVLGAMNALARRGRMKLIPALILLHDDETVLVRALELFGSSTREDWVTRTRKLLHGDRESVRIAAARALATHGHLTASDLTDAAGPRTRGYAALHRALQDTTIDPVAHSDVTDILSLQGGDSEQAQLGLLSAIADASAGEQLGRLVAKLAERPWTSAAWTVELARAITSQRAQQLLPSLVARLASRNGRDAVRSALVGFGAPGLELLSEQLASALSPRDLRIHIPNTIARFGTRRAAEVLLETIDRDGDGLVRYKAIRALGRLTAERGLKLERRSLEALALRNLIEHVRLLVLRASLVTNPLQIATPPGDRPPTERILVGLLNDKLRQSLERTFRLLKIAYPKEDIHGAHTAYSSSDRRVRANASEFLDTLLRRGEGSMLRELLRALGEELSLSELSDLVRGDSVPETPSSSSEALAVLARDKDATIAALAKLHIAASLGEPARVAIGARERQPIELDVGSQPALPRGEACHV